MDRRIVLLAILLCAALTATARVCQAQRSHGWWTSETPAPGGSNQVGTLSVQLTDAGRQDPYLTNGSNRRLVVRLWYPALAQTCQPAEYTSERVWNYISRLAGAPLPSVKTHSCLNAAAVGGTHPIILFTHGYTGTLTDATFLFEDLASRGFIVASLAHTYETTAVEFPDGRFVTSAVGSYISGDLRLDDATLQRARSVRLADISFVLRELQRLNTASASPVAGRLDVSQVGVMGHSVGSEVAIASMAREIRIRAAVALDGVFSSAAVPVTAKPVLLIAASRDQWTPEECQLWDAMHGLHTAINLRGADHFTPTDAIWVFQSLPGFASSVGSMGRAKTISAIRSYVAAFFGANLRGNANPELLNSPAYPDAVVINQRQALCRANSFTAKGGSQ